MNCIFFLCADEHVQVHVSKFGLYSQQRNQIEDELFIFKELSDYVLINLDVNIALPLHRFAKTISDPEKALTLTEDFSVSLGSFPSSLQPEYKNSPLFFFFFNEPKCI